MKTKCAGFLVVFALLLASLMPAAAGWADRVRVYSWCIVGHKTSGAPIYQNVVTDCIPSSGGSCFISYDPCITPD